MSQKQWKFRLWDGASNRGSTISADTYDEACWQAGVDTFPPSYIWSIEPKMNAISEFRKLQEKLERIDESYFSRLAAAADDMALYNQRMPVDELVKLIRTELGDQAAQYISDKLAKGGRIEEDIDEAAPSVQKGDRIKIQREHHIGNKIEEFAGTVIDVSQDVHGYKVGVVYRDGNKNIRAWYHVNGVLSGRWYDERIMIESEIEEDTFYHEEDTISAQVKSLLAQGKEVRSAISGAIGKVTRTDGRLLYIQNLGRQEDVTSFDNNPEYKIHPKGFYYVIESDYENELDEGIDEGKWDYPDHIKGKGSSPDYLRTDILNKEARKKFRKAEKAKAHQARMRGEVDEDVMDERGKMCPVCIGQRREGYGNDCPNCNGEGYVDEAVGVGEELPPIHAIARDVIKNWKKPYFGAVPYLDAMQSLSTKHDAYGADSGSSILAYGLSNMSHYSGRSVHDPELAKKHRAQLKRHLNEAIVEVPAGLRGEDQENLEQGGYTSRDAERFLADLGPNDSVDTEVIDPDSGEVLDWPTKDTRRDQDDAEYAKQETERQSQEDEDEDSILSTPYIPGGQRKTDAGGVESFDYVDRAQEDLGKLRWDQQITDFYDMTWRNIEDLVDEPQQYYDGDYDIGWDMPVAIKRTDGQKFTDEDHNNFRRLTSLFRAATHNISASYVGTSDNGTVARFVPSFH